MSRRTNKVMAATVLVVAFSCLIPVPSGADFSATTDAEVRITILIPDDTTSSEDVVTPDSTDVEPEPEPDPEPEPPSDATDTTPPETEVVTPTPEPEPEAAPVAPVVDPVVPEPSAQEAPTPSEPEGSFVEELSE